MTIHVQILRKRTSYYVLQTNMDSLTSFLTKCKICKIQTIQFIIDLSLQIIARMLSFRVFRFEIFVSLSIYLFPQSFCKLTEPCPGQILVPQILPSGTYSQGRQKSKEGNNLCLQQQTSEYREETEENAQLEISIYLQEHVRMALERHSLLS